MEQNLRGERRAGWRWGLWGQCIALYRRWLPRQPMAPARRSVAVASHVLAGGRGLVAPSRAIAVFSTWWWGAEAQHCFASLRPLPRPLSFASFPWRCAGGASGPGGRAGASGFGVQASGERSASGRRSGLGRRGVSARWKQVGGRVAALHPLSRQQFVFLIPALTDYQAGAEILCTSIKGYFSSGSHTVVHQGASPFIFICLMLTVFWYCSS